MLNDRATIRSLQEHSQQPVRLQKIGKIAGFTGAIGEIERGPYPRGVFCSVRTSFPEPDMLRSPLPCLALALIASPLAAQNFLLTEVTSEAA